MAEPFSPLFPADVTEINRHVSFAKREGRIYYFNGPMPVFSHDEKDLASFRMFTIQIRLDEGQAISGIASELKLKADTLNKAVRSGRLKAPAKKKTEASQRTPPATRVNAA